MLALLLLPALAALLPAQPAKEQEAAPEVLPHPAVDPRHQQALVAVAADQQEDAQRGQDDVRRPHGHPGGDLAEARSLLAVAQQDVVDDDDRDRQREAGRLAAAPVVDSQGQSKEAEDEAGHRDRKLLVDLDAGEVALLVHHRGVLLEVAKLTQGELPDPLGDRDLGLLLGGELLFEHQVEPLVPADLVAVGSVQVHLVTDGVVEAEDDLLARRIHPDLPPVGDGDLVVLARGDRFGQEDPLPALLAGRNLEDVDHLAVPLLVEHPRLYLARDALCGDLQAQLLQGVVAPGQRVDHEQGVDHGEEAREEQNRPVEGEEAHAAGAHGDQLAVRRQPADGDQDAEQERHRQGKDHDVRHGVQQQLADDRDRKAAADDHLGRLEQEPDEQDEGID
jgi:hypothetical protein